MGEQQEARCKLVGSLEFTATTNRRRWTFEIQRSRRVLQRLRPVGHRR